MIMAPKQSEMGCAVIGHFSQTWKSSVGEARQSFDNIEHALAR